MTLIALTYVSLGLLFGLLTYPTRHLYSEGPTRPGNAVATTGAQLGGRVFWALMASYLWPVMIATRGYTAWVKRGS